MDFKSLRYVLAVAENGSVSEAAKELGISQPSLSKYLQNLSEGLGVQMFERSEGRLRPTYAGERYISGIRQILPLTDELYRLDDDPVGKRYLRVACPPFEGSYIHPFAIARFHRDCPDARLMMVESMDTASLLLSGEADVAIINHRLNKPELANELLIRDEVLLVTGGHHPIANQAIWKEGCKYPWVDVGHFRNEAFIQLFPDQSTRAKAEELMHREQVHPPILLQTRSVLTAIRVASTGTGFCFAPETGIRHFKFPEPPAFYSVGDPLLMDVYVVHVHKRPLSREAEYFIRLVRNFLV